MKTHRLEIDEFDLDDERQHVFIAIHATIDGSLAAFLINSNANLRLRRKEKDFIKMVNNLPEVYEHFTYDDESAYLVYDLFKNQYQTVESQIMSSTGLFAGIAEETKVKKHLSPSHRRADYILRIQSEGNTIASKSILTQINQIPQVISAYIIDRSNYGPGLNQIIE